MRILACVYFSCGALARLDRILRMEPVLRLDRVAPRGTLRHRPGQLIPPRTVTQTGGRKPGSKNRTLAMEAKAQATAEKIEQALGGQAFDGDSHALLMAALHRWKCVWTQPRQQSGSKSPRCHRLTRRATQHRAISPICPKVAPLPRNGLASMGISGAKAM